MPESVHLSPEELGSSVFLSMDLSWSALELVHAHIAHRAVAPQPSPIAPKRCGNAPRRWDYQFVPDDLEVYPKSTPSKKNKRIIHYADAKSQERCNRSWHLAVGEPHLSTNHHYTTKTNPNLAHQRVSNNKSCQKPAKSTKHNRARNVEYCWMLPISHNFCMHVL